MSQEDTRKIQELIARFANSFDTKDWNSLKECLMESLYTDYSDLRGTPPETVSCDSYVASRQESLRDLVTHHLGGNYEIQYINDLQATCRASMVIWRKVGDAQFTTHCIYTFQVKKNNASWKIAGITQKIFWNEGNPAIHHGAK
jgi:hypothetical protein